ncbi:ABC transporter substrate-binding protein [Rhodobacterales bacterium HKCCE2091]|nr:ABC transporter substrate-binding protein [Rhodobacterales bacterium HKCCE2091]
MIAFLTRPLATLAALALSAGAVLADAAPSRVVSMNLCTDQIALMLAAPGQLVSVSDIASDPLTSPMWREARALPPNHGSAEEIFLLSPDLVLAGVWSDPTTVDLLRRLGLRVEQVPAPAGLDDIPDGIRRIGALLGREAEAETLAASFDTRLAALRDPDPDGPEAVFYYPNGYTLTPGSLSDEVLTAAGFRNLAARLDIPGNGQIALETLVAAGPGMILTTGRYPGASRSEALLDHPALRSVEGPEGPFVTGNEWICGTPAILDALESLSARRDRMGAG